MLTVATSGAIVLLGGLAGTAQAVGTTERVSVGAGGAQTEVISRVPAISPGGRFVAFDSQASNLVPGDTNGIVDVFVRSRWGSMPSLLGRPARAGSPD